MIVKSNHPDGAKSGGIKHQEHIRRDTNHDVVGEFVLSNYIEQPGWRVLGKRPVHHLFQRSKRSGFVKNIGMHRVLGER